MTEHDALSLIENGLGLDTGTISMESKSQDFDEWDSMGIMGILTELSDSGIEIGPNEIGSFRTAAGIVNQLRAMGILEP